MVFATVGAPAEEAVHKSLAFVPMYLSFATIEALDVTSTVHALDHGGREANPIVAGAWQSPAAVVALKAGATAAVIYGVQRLRKDKPKAALILMIAADSAMATIVAHNYAIGR